MSKLIFAMMFLAVATFSLPGRAAPAAVEAEADEIAALIGQLGHEDYETRDEAHQRLKKMGPAAFDALAAAELNNDPETSRRAQLLLRTIRIPWTRDDDPAEVRRILRNYDALGERQRRERIAAFAAMTADDATAALCRIVRYEKSTTLAKSAALLIIDRPPPEGEALARQRAAIESGLTGCRRSSAHWLLAYSRFFAAPDEALEAWEKLAASETALVKSSPGETTVDIVVALRKRQYAMLLAAGRKDDATAALRQIIPLHPPTPAALSRLVQWLATQKAWPVIDEVALRYQPQFDTNPRLMYALAQAKQSAGQNDAAKAAADRALALDPDNAEQHFEIAYWLAESGHVAWAEREYRQVIKQGPEGAGMSLQAGLFLAIMLQDQERYLDSARAREAIVKLTEQKPELREILENADSDFYSPSRIRATMDYCYAMHYGSIGEAARQRQYLEKAIAADPDDADVLIALWRLPSQTEAQRTGMRTRLQKATAAFERKIAAIEARIGRGETEAKLATALNEYAWLVANTTGDFDKALRHAIRANEIRPETAGYLDTLAHCYYAKGDVDAALATQTRANKLEPHSGAIARQLKVFEKAAAARKERAAAPKAPEPA